MSLPQLDSKNQSRITGLYWASALFVLLAGGLLYGYGGLGIAAIALLLLLVAITPLLINRYALFLFLWLFVVPVFDSFHAFTIAGTNPVVFLITALTLPFSLLLIFRDFSQITRHLPFALFLLLFDLVLFLNILRPERDPSSVSETLKLFIELFVIFCSYRLIRNGKAETLFNQLNLFFILNALIAVFQRVSGIGLWMIEGVPRVASVLGHPNVLGCIIVLYLPFGIYKVLTAETRKNRIFWLTGVILNIIALLLTVCKTSIATMFLQFAILFLFLPKHLKIRCLIAVLAFSLIALGADFIFGLGYLQGFSDRMGNDDSWEWRLKTWSYLINDYTPLSVLFGHGINSAKITLRTINPSTSDFVHNVYLQLYYEVGLGILLFLAALLHPVRTFAAAFFQKLALMKRLTFIFPLLIILAVLIDMATSNSMMQRTAMSFLWLFLTYFSLQKDDIPGNPDLSSPQK